MATFDDPRFVLDALSAPMGDLIAAVGTSVADAQRALDAQTIANFQALYGEDGEAFEALRSIGYRPTWYHIPEVNGEIKVALAVAGERSGSGSPGAGRTKLALYGAPVDAGYTSKFNYTLEASSTVSFRIVPVPPSPAAEQLRVAPSLVGKSWADAKQQLELLDVAYELGGPAPAAADVLTGQSPEPGAILLPGQRFQPSFD